MSYIKRLISSDSELERNLPLYDSIAIVVYNGNNIQMCIDLANCFKDHYDINTIKHVVLLGTRDKKLLNNKRELECNVFPTAKVTTSNKMWYSSDIKALKIRSTLVIHICSDIDVDSSMYDEDYGDGTNVHRIVNQSRTAYYMVILPGSNSLFPNIDCVIRKNLDLTGFEYEESFQAGTRSSFCQERDAYINSFMQEASLQDIFFQCIDEAEHGCEVCNQCSSYDINKHCPSARHLVAKFYREGMYIPQDKRIAHQWERMAARQGYVDAEIQVANDLKEGNGIKQDLEKAIEIYLRHAKSNLHCTRQLIALSEQDDILYKGLALPFISYHAQQGNEEMILLLVKSLQAGHFGLPEDDNAALAWLEHGATFGYISCLRQAAEIHELNHDWEKSYDRYTALCRLVPDAIPKSKLKEIETKMLTDGLSPQEVYIKGRDYLYGYFGRKRNPQLAHSYLNHASSKGVYSATGLLSYMHYYGICVCKAEGLAKILLKNAANNGDLRSLYFCYTNFDNEDTEWAGIKARLFGRIEEMKKEYDTYAYYLDGLCHYENKYPETDSQRGFCSMKYAAEHGEPEAQYKLARMLIDGFGTPINKSEANRWMRIAAENGDYHAKCYLGREYLCNEGFDNKELALSYLKDAKEQCIQENCVRLAWAYLHQRSTMKEKENAFKTLETLANEGNADAQVFLCEVYYCGVKGFGKDYRKCFEWGEKAIAQGKKSVRFEVAYSASELGYCERAKELYLELSNEGDALAMNNYACELSDLVERAEWFKKAADNGDSFGYWNLGICYRDCEGVEKDEKMALELLIKASQNGCAFATYDIAQMYLDGSEVDIDKSIEWYKKTINVSFSHEDYDVTEIMCELAAVYIERVVPANFDEALHYYKLAAEQDNTDALYHIGKLYEDGSGTQVDIHQAIYWYRKAANKGHAMAKQCLERLDTNWIEDGKIVNDSKINQDNG